MVEPDSTKTRSQAKNQPGALRLVTAGLFISLDGVVEAPDQWQFDNFDEDMVTIMSDYLASVDAILLGRVTYQEWVNYWPNSDDEPYASHINNTPKYVVSKTLDRVDWKNATLVKGPLADELQRLKRQTGKNISTAGSPTLTYSLLQQALLDELTLMIHPVVVGRGKRFFQNSSDLRRLRLVDSKTTRTGVIVATYRPLETAK